MSKTSRTHFLRSPGVRIGLIAVSEKAFAVLLGVVLTRWLGPSDYGLYAFTMTSIALVVIVAKFGVPSLLMREVAASRGDPTRYPSWAWLLGCLRATATTSGVLTMTVVLLSLVAGQSENGMVRPALIVGALLIPVITMQELLSQALRGQGHAILASLDYYFLPTFSALLGISVIVFIFHAPTSPALALSTRVAANSASVLAMLWGVHRTILSNRSGRKDVTLPTRRAVLRGGFPFLMLDGTAMIMARIDVAILGLLSIYSDVGIYNAAVQGIQLLMMVANSANMLIVPEFGRIYHKDGVTALQPFVTRSARIILALSLPVGLGLILLGGPFLSLLFGHPFATGAGPMSILVLAYLLSLTAGNPWFLLTMTGHENVAIKLALSTAALNVILNSILIPKFGIYGAAVATGIAWNAQAFMGQLLVESKMLISSHVLG